jgi:hypothetical protein
MTVTAELHDGRTLEFPDGTDPSVVQATVKKVLGGAQTPFVPSGEKVQPSWTSPEGIAGNPVTRFALGAASPFIGAAQLGANLVGAGASINEHLAQLERMKQEGRQQMGSTGFDWMEGAGTLVSPAFLKAAQLVPGGLSFVQKIIAGAGLGTVGGATAPVTKEGDFAGQKTAQIGAGAALGAVLPPVASGVGSVGKAAYRGLIEPWANPAAIKGRAYLDAAGAKVQEILANLRNPREIVPGSSPTAGEAALPAASAEFSALQRQASDIAPSDYVARADQQNAARLAALRTVGQDETALEGARTARSAAADPLYAAARQQSVTSNATLEALLKRPSMDKAFSRAAELSKEQNQPFAIGQNQPARNVPSTIVSESGEPAFTTQIPATSQSYPVNSLHNIKMALDDMVKNPERFGIGASEVSAIKQTRNGFVKWLEGNVPKYGEARATYAEKSAPINQMQIGQYLERKLVPALDETARQKATTFATAVENAPGTIKQATGAPRFETLEQALTPDQVKVVESIRNDLARGVRFEDLAKKGAQAAPDISGAMGREKLPNLLNRHVMLLNAIIGRLEGKVNTKLAAEMAVEMLNPPRVAQSIQEALTRQQRNATMTKMVEQAQMAGAAATGAKARSVLVNTQGP